jgi:glycosyltransferase involved in cell wall biosynthesis
LSESLFAGTPVLTTDTAGAREVIEDGRSGRIVPVGDETAFATALGELAANPALIKEMGLYGRRQMESRMTGPAVAAALRDFYTEARHA